MNHEENMEKYGDIIHLSRPTSKNHPSMPVLDRAAQFAPFAALTGHNEAIQEVIRQSQEAERNQYK